MVSSCQWACRHSLTGFIADHLGLCRWEATLDVQVYLWFQEPLALDREQIEGFCFQLKCLPSNLSWFSLLLQKQQSLFVKPTFEHLRHLWFLYTQHFANQKARAFLDQFLSQIKRIAHLFQHVRQRSVGEWSSDSLHHRRHQRVIFEVLESASWRATAAG